MNDLLASDFTEERPRGVAQVRRMIAREHPFRWAGIEHDMAWLRKQAKKHGMNPEDARWLL